MKGLPKQQEIADDNFDVPEITQDELNAIYEYNKNVTTLDEEYAKVVPMSKILLRVFLLEPYESENGLLEPHKQMLNVPSNNGVGSVLQIESPFPYSDKAIVVAVPPMYSLIQPGDIVQLESNAVKVLGAGANASIHIPGAYMHTSSPTIEIPRSSDNRHYGYLMLPFQEIKAKIV